jgi:hypothetical protein
MTCHFLDAQKLKPGDVVLECGDGKLSALIKFVDKVASEDERTRARFSHAFIYVGAGMIMEADEGVRMLIAARVVTDAPDTFLILRHPDQPDGIGVSWLKEMGDLSLFAALQPEANKPYAWWGAVRSVLRIGPKQQNAFFCSEVVGEAYRRAGVTLFDDDRAPEDITPNALLSKQCRLEPINAASCFTALPDVDWVHDAAKKNRYEVMASEAIPLAQTTHETAKQLVATFGKRLDRATALIGKSQTIATQADIILTLFFPDLPDGNAISDDVVAFMRVNFPREQAKQYREMHKIAGQAMLAENDPGVLHIMRGTLMRDLQAVSAILQLMQQQIDFIRSVPCPPFKRRSFHDWQLEALKEQIEEEAALLEWRRDMLRDLEAKSGAH